MKKLEIIIREEKLEEVKKVFADAGYLGMTISSVSGRGRQEGISLSWRTGDYKVEFLPKMKIEVVILKEDLPKIVNGIMGAARTGSFGDGKIFVIPVEDAFRIRTGEAGTNAI